MSTTLYCSERKHETGYKTGEMDHVLVCHLEMKGMVMKFYLVIYCYSPTHFCFSRSLLQFYCKT